MRLAKWARSCCCLSVFSSAADPPARTSMDRYGLFIPDVWLDPADCGLHSTYTAACRPQTTASVPTSKWEASALSTVFNCDRHSSMDPSFNSAVIVTDASSVEFTQVSSSELSVASRDQSDVKEESGEMSRSRGSTFAEKMPSLHVSEALNSRVSSLNAVAHTPHPTPMTTNAPADMMTSRRGPPVLVTRFSRLPDFASRLVAIRVPHLAIEVGTFGVFWHWNTRTTARAECSKCFRWASALSFSVRESVMEPSSGTSSFCAGNAPSTWHLT